MISVAEALAIVAAQCTQLPVESVPVAAALGRVLACELRSSVNLPPFDNSAMDGFALRGGGQGLAAGLEFSVLGEQAPGDGCLQVGGEGAWEIMTGARLPEGMDTVVPVEQVEVIAFAEDGRPLRIRLSASVPPGQHLRRTGEDIERGAVAIAAGGVLAPQHLLLLSGLGIADLPVVRKPRVAVLCTGRELVDDPSVLLRPGQIRNSNGPFLSARLQAAGAELVFRDTVADDEAAFEAALACAIKAGADMVLSTGAVSMGRYDFVPPTLKKLGAHIFFHKVAMRPGKPLLFARMAGGQLYFGLPGNPVSSAVGLRFFVESALRIQLGLSPESGWRLPLAHSISKKAGFRLYQKGGLQLSSDGRLSVALVSGQESFKTLPLMAATAWAVLPEEAEQMPAGTPVEVFGLGHEMGVFLGEQMT